MSIQEIISALQSKGVTITAAALESFLLERNVNPADVTEATIDAIASELAPTAIAVAPKGGKPTTRRKKGSTEQAQQPVTTVQDALAQAAKNSAVEIGAMVEAAKDWSDETADLAGTEIYNQIKSTSGKTVLKIAQLAAEDAADPDFFRGAIGDILQGVEIPV